MARDAGGDRMRRKTVLLVDDEKDYREILRHFLEKGGYRVTAFGSGEEALAALHATAPDVVLLDVGLPGLDGVEVCRRIRADPAFGRVPILMVTVQTGTDDTVAGLSSGADDYVGKPFDPDEVLARIAALLR
jgi:DNA-binding response OmpR family regulator